MKEHPILFSGLMVRAILEGWKKVTRRSMKPQPVLEGHFWTFGGAGWSDRINSVTPVAGHSLANNCPYGQPGDRLWVRETFFAFGRWETRFSQKKGRDEWHFIDMTLDTGRSYQYDRLEGQDFKPQRSSISPAWWMRPSIHMPRRASRILLEVTSVRVERLQDISEEQALAEGVRGEPCDHARQACTDIGCWGDTAKGAFGFLWEQLNGASAWQANPWVWVVEFKRVTP